MPTPNSLIIATRRSPLALWQAEHVQALLEQAHPGLTVTLLPMQTRGDKILDTPLAKIGGKALFVKELETALLEGAADIAVHSLKDVPAELPEGLALPCIMQREDPSDAWVSNQYDSPADLPQGACVGTSSLRRRCQLLAQRPDLVIKDLRGNVGTRLGKLDAGEYDAIILASAGLKRLGLADRIRCALSVEQSLPAIGQGILGIETRENDARVAALLKPLHDQTAADCAAAERGLNGGLAGGCQAPVAGYATLDGDRLLLQGLVGLVDGSEILREQIVGNRRQAAELGAQLAVSMRSKGADRILASVGL